MQVDGSARRSVGVTRRALLQGLAALRRVRMAAGGLGQGAATAVDAPRFAALSTTHDRLRVRGPGARVVDAEGAGLGDRRTDAREDRDARREHARRTDWRTHYVQRSSMRPPRRSSSRCTRAWSIRPKGPVVFTYNEALAWQAVPWTKPNALCGGQTDYWSSAPPDGQVMATLTADVVIVGSGIAGAITGLHARAKRRQGADPRGGAARRSREGHGAVPQLAHQEPEFAVPRASQGSAAGRGRHRLLLRAGGPRHRSAACRPAWSGARRGTGAGSRCAIVRTTSC